MPFSPKQLAVIALIAVAAVAAGNRISSVRRVMAG